jgi:phenylacetate-CoA ligase
VELTGSLARALDRYRASHEQAVAAVVREAAAQVPAFAARLGSAGVDPGSVQGARDLAALPVLTKDDVLARQRAEPPFGGLLAPGAAVRRIFQSPGPLYEPQPAGADPWRWAPALRAAGFSAGDVVLNCFGYHLSPAGAMLEEGALALGCEVVPAGVGAMDLQARAVADLGVSAYLGLPSYLKALISKFSEVAPREQWRVHRALVTAEPLPDSLRDWLASHVPVVHSAYGTAEVGLIGYEVAPGSGLRLADGVFVEVCDLDTGSPLDEGEGQVVVTLLRADYPLVRFGTGDLSAWTLGEDGEPRLAGVLGRVGQAVKVRGMFLHPRQAQAALASLPGVAAYRFVVERAEHLDRLRCEVVPAAGADRGALAERVRSSVRAGLRFDAEVTLVDGLPPDAGVIDDRRDWS